VHDGEDGARVVRELLAKGAADAVFAANNRASVGAVLGFARAGERLPLIGFDDFESATLVTPQASVVEQDIPTMGRAAAERLIARIEGDDSPPQRLVLPTRLVLRGSER
jgi:LacI family transcriptional regulator